MSGTTIFKRLREHPERGSISVYVVIIAAVLMLVAGLCIEGGRVLNARATMADQAEQAARSSAARSYLARSGAAQTTTVKASSDRVSVTVERDVPTTMLRLVGVTSIHVTVTGEARNAFGPEERRRPRLPKTGNAIGLEGRQNP